MKAIVKTKPEKGFEILDVEEPQISNSTDVKIKVLKSSICGTDYHIYSWDDWSQKTIKLPHLNGHEVLAEITEMGNKVTNLQIGQIVVCETHIYCGSCYQCQTGNMHVCQNMNILGVNIDGIWGEYQVVPQSILIDVQGIKPSHAGIMEPLGNAIHTLSYSELRGRNVLISGPGPIGILAAYVAKVSGAARVMISGSNEYRLNMIRAMNIDVDIIDLKQGTLKEQVQAITANEGIDIVAEMSGNPKGLSDAIEVLNPAGDLNILSVYPMEKVEIALNDLVFKNIKIQAVTGRKLFDTWYTASRWLKQGVLESDSLDCIITHEFKMEEFEQAFKLIEEKKCGKIVLDFSYLHQK